MGACCVAVVPGGGLSTGGDPGVWATAVLMDKESPSKKTLYMIFRSSLSEVETPEREGLFGLPDVQPADNVATKLTYKIPEGGAAE